MEKIKMFEQQEDLSHQIREMYDLAHEWGTIALLDDKIIMFSGELIKKFGKDALNSSPAYRELVHSGQISSSEILKNDKEAEIEEDIASFVAQMKSLIKDDFKEF